MSAPSVSSSTSSSSSYFSSLQYSYQQVEAHSGASQAVSRLSHYSHATSFYSYQQSRVEHAFSQSEDLEGLSPSEIEELSDDESFTLSFYTGSEGSEEIDQSSQTLFPCIGEGSSAATGLVGSSLRLLVRGLPLAALCLHIATLSSGHRLELILKHLPRYLLLFSVVGISLCVSVRARQLS